MTFSNYFHQLALKISSQRDFPTSSLVDYSDVPDREPEREYKYQEGKIKFWDLDGNRELQILPDGTKRWFQNRSLHREDGPAIEHANGAKSWYRNGWPHREDGPAYEGKDGIVEYWLNGERIETKSKDFNSPQFQKRWQKLLELERVRQVMED